VNCCWIRFSRWYTLDVRPLGSLHCVDVANVADVSEERATSTFKAEPSDNGLLCTPLPPKRLVTSPSLCPVGRQPTSRGWWTRTLHSHSPYPFRTCRLTVYAAPKRRQHCHTHLVHRTNIKININNLIDARIKFLTPAAVFKNSVPTSQKTRCISPIMQFRKYNRCLFWELYGT
jgi:hypothetical protein